MNIYQFVEDNKIVFHTDSEYGWLQVPKALLERFGIEKKISGFSFQRDGFVYLEEDHDAPTFICAVFSSAVERQIFLNAVPEKYTDEEAPIRSYDRYS